jgi:hypothetical protein
MHAVLSCYSKSVFCYEAIAVGVPEKPAALGKRLRGLLQSTYPAYAENYAKCTKGEAEPHGRRYEDGGARG